MPREYFSIPPKVYKRIMDYLKHRAQEERISRSRYLFELVMKDYERNINTVEAMGMQYDVDVVNRTMKLHIPAEVREILGLRYKTVLVNLK